MMEHQPARKVLASINGGQFEIVPLTPDLLKESFPVMREFFFNQRVCKALKIDDKAVSELVNLCIDAASDGVSLAAVEQSTGIVAGALFNKIEVRPEPGVPTYYEKFQLERCSGEAAKALIRLILVGNEAVDPFEVYNVDCIFDLFLLSVMPTYRRNGIGRKLMETSMELAYKLKNGELKRDQVCDGQYVLKHDKIAQAATIFCVNPLPLKVSKELNMIELGEVRYDTFFHEGKSLINTADVNDRAGVILGKLLE